ncbi:mannose-6-phosphate isomerase-like protein (cupin superfamily) [Actinomadura coerulea]|uniref:Mannose-6-phosphate isomerase-like protein (Cupin superfamily) n=1 Tax=Actinomadura coerulea TaxID=46159 RepID=A0A7X0L202_9ACTN|nr:cupin domain-containing protein [Actinomadura coerulea]MBB6398719.1 mannose-6-phosphate isomerase-like protein (cupin superfamily) [Actinomadura coerulea]GGP99807.1 cupin [Actinomadura coerulea]
MHPLVVIPEAAEVVGLPEGGAFTLLADASQTAGALGANRLTVGPGRDGAAPHYHALSTELFYVVDGTMEFLLGDRVETVAAGGLVVVPPRLPHAFGAAAGTGADLLAVLAPGVERFGYFRRLARVQHGLEPFDGLRSEQDRYDVHFVDDERWSSLRGDR